MRGAGGADVLAGHGADLRRPLHALPSRRRHRAVSTRVTYPVKPGWGTRNEMCLAVLFFTVPKDALKH
jgi:hypothetical protein